MKFFCEYCGNRIDAEVDEKCPNCGASYKKNKSFIELEKNRNMVKDLITKEEELFQKTLLQGEKRLEEIFSELYVECINESNVGKMKIKKKETKNQSKKKTKTSKK